jgi:hypothetical protein
MAQKRAIVPVRKGDNLHRSVDRKQFVDEDGGGGFAKLKSPLRSARREDIRPLAGYR